jgi:FKBP-type peptidyl-prolyl cis-trans isomerase FklB
MFAMKTIILTAIFSVTAAAPLLADDTTLSTNENTRVSYALGMYLGESWKAHDITNLDYDMLLRGLNDAESGGATLMTVPEMHNTLGQFQQKLARQQEQQRQELADKNLQISDAFLAKNKKEDGVVTLSDGLQYKVITEGSGPSPTNSDTVTVSYEGTLVDGTVFDSSDKATFQVGGVIPGWREALTRMKAGSQWKLFIPPDLAYGPYGRPPKIEPNAVLIFNLHLLSIEHPQPVTSDIIKVPSAEEMKKGAKVEIIKPEDVQKMQQQSQSAK